MGKLNEKFSVFVSDLPRSAQNSLSQMFREIAYGGVVVFAGGPVSLVHAAIHSSFPLRFWPALITFILLLWFVMFRYIAVAVLSVGSVVTISKSD